MSAVLPATHLLRRYLLFVLTSLFLLTMIRAAYVLWQFESVATAGALVDVFVQGLRFDLALLGALLFVPVLVFTLLSMFRFSRGLVKVLTALWLTLSLVLVLLGELLSVWTMSTRGGRAGPSEWAAINTPVDTLVQVLKDHPIPAGIGALLTVLIVFAFWRRLEVSRLLTFRIGTGGALALAFLGAIACLFAVWSGPVVGQPPLSVSDATVWTDTTVNEIALNAGFKWLSPVLDLLPGGDAGTPG